MSSARGTVPVDGGEIAYLIVGEGPPVAATHPYVNPKSGYGAGGYGIHISTLILAGGRDRGCTPAQARIIAGGIPGSVLRVFEQAGHGVRNQRPSGVEDLVMDFVHAHAPYHSRRGSH